MSIHIESKWKPGLGHNFCNLLSGLKYVENNDQDQVYINNSTYNLIFYNPPIINSNNIRKIYSDEKLLEISNNLFYKNLIEIYFKQRIKPFILKEIKRFRKKNFNSDFISVAIRTWNSSTNPSTNNTKAEARSRNLNMFNFDKWIKILSSPEYTNNIFFVTVDNDSYKDLLKKKFGNRVIFYERNTNKLINKYNTNDKNLIYDFVEMYLLSLNSKMIGFSISGFFKIATLFSSKTTQICYI